MSAATRPAGSALPSRCGTTRPPRTSATASRSSPGFTGTVSGTTATLSAGSDRLVAELDAGWLDVTGTVRGRAVHVRAKLGSEPAGLYRLSRTDGTTIGWIVQPDGSQVGLETQNGRVAAAPVLVPGQPVTVQGEAAYPKEVSGDDRF